MNIWLVSREYDCIAEAGGVKIVARSLAENLVALGHKVTLFIPLYGCTRMARIEDFTCMWHKPVSFALRKQRITITFSHGKMNGVEIVFIGNKLFSEKKGVYVYTAEEEKQNPCHRRGSGHEDSSTLNTLFQKAVIGYGETCSDKEKPDIIHCQDATAALVPVFLKYKSSIDEKTAAFYKNTACVVTIHNAGPGYHHEFCSLQDAGYQTCIPDEFLAKGLHFGRVEPFLLAAREGATLTTVSPEYAQEIMCGKTDTAGLSDAFREYGIQIYGITNGIDFSHYSPENTAASKLPFAFNPEKGDLDGKYRCRNFFLLEYAKKNSSLAEGIQERYGFLENSDNSSAVYIVYHGRVVNQKGISVLAQAAKILYARNLPVNFVFIGQGQPDLEAQLASLSDAAQGKCVYFKGYNQALVRLCMAMADFAVFPSFFEPCGLMDFIAQIYGTLPVAHATGGLKKIVDDETGFLYEPNTPEVLADELTSLILIKSRTEGTIFTPLIAYATKYVRQQFSWRTVAQKYVDFYENLLKNVKNPQIALDKK